MGLCDCLNIVYMLLIVLSRYGLILKLFQNLITSRHYAAAGLGTESEKTTIYSIDP